MLYLGQVLDIQALGLAGLDGHALGQIQLDGNIDRFVVIKIDLEGDAVLARFLGCLFNYIKFNARLPLVKNIRIAAWNSGRPEPPRIPSGNVISEVYGCISNPTWFALRIFTVYTCPIGFCHYGIGKPLFSDRPLFAVGIMRL